MDSSNPAGNFPSRFQIMHNIGEAVVSILGTNSFFHLCDQQFHKCHRILFVSSMLSLVEHCGPSKEGVLTFDSQHSIVT